MALFNLTTSLLFGALFLGLFVAGTQTPLIVYVLTPEVVSETIATSTALEPETTEEISIPNTSGSETENLVPPREQVATPNKPTSKPEPTAEIKPESPIVQTTPESSPANFDVINQKARAVLVNVFCTAKPGSKLPSYSGSGIIVDSRGLVITNAHVAEHLLIKDYDMPGALTCTLRTGSPARNTYTTELVYLPPSWVSKNAVQITSQNPTGTGEDDYAFLRITGTTDGSSLPSSFPFLSPETNEAVLNPGAPLLVAAYPAGFLGSANIETALYPITNLSQIGALYTFEKETLDLISLGSIAVSQKGSSGGGAINSFEKLIALVVTTSDGATTADRDLRGITMGHINRSMLKNYGESLAQFLTKDPALEAKKFTETTAPALAAQLTAEYDKK